MLFISILKIIRFSNLTLKIFKINENETVGNNNNKANKIIKNLSKFKKFKNNKLKNLMY